MVGFSSEWVICIALSIGIGFTTSTDSLDFSQSNLTEVPICPVNHSIASINLDENTIQELFPHSFNNCDDLTKMSLASNGLQKIHDGTFHNIHKLNSLTLNDNSIVQLPADFGPSTTTLYTIALLNAMRDPRLFNYPYFSAFTRLGIINLGFNNIGNLNDTFFPPNIRWIVANSGRMDTFPSISSLTPNIQVLAFSGHQLTIIPQKAVAGLFELEALIMSKNIIKNFPNFSHCKKLTLLQFEHNELSYIPRKHIEGLESIREIHFTNNWLSNMTDISHLISLQKFFIGFNLITEMPVWHIEGLPYMKTFACNNNKLKSLPNISSIFSWTGGVVRPRELSQDIARYVWVCPFGNTAIGRKSIWVQRVSVLAANVVVVEAIREYTSGQSRLWLTSCIRWYNSCTFPPYSHGML